MLPTNLSFVRVSDHFLLDFGLEAAIDTILYQLCSTGMVPGNARNKIPWIINTKVMKSWRVKSNIISFWHHLNGNDRYNVFIVKIIVKTSTNRRVWDSEGTVELRTVYLQILCIYSHIKGNLNISTRQFGWIISRFGFWTRQLDKTV